MKRTLSLILAGALVLVALGGGVAWHLAGPAFAQSPSTTAQ